MGASKMAMVIAGSTRMGTTVVVRKRLEAGGGEKEKAVRRKEEARLWPMGSFFNFQFRDFSFNKLIKIVPSKKIN